MNCKYCGRKIDNNSTFCRFCGCSTEIHNGYIFNSADNFDEWIEGKSTEDTTYRPRYDESNIKPIESDVPKTEELYNPMIDDFMPAQNAISQPDIEAVQKKNYGQSYPNADVSMMPPAGSYQEHPDISQKGFQHRMNTRRQVRKAREHRRLMLTRVVAAAVMLIVFVVIAVFLVTTIGKNTEQDDVTMSQSDEGSSENEIITPKDETETVLDSENVSIQEVNNPENIIYLSNDSDHTNRLIKIDNNYYVHVKSLFNAMTGSNEAYHSNTDDNRLDFVFSGAEQNIKVDIINQEFIINDRNIVFPVTVRIVKDENEDRLVYISLKDFCDNMGYTIINSGE
ncbi:MAG: zinc ribbon domain-containing protein [Candidatus Ornithomonoglobus sp.]